MFEAAHISFGYGRTDVFSDVSFSLAAGEAVALVGANGAGKTTLLRLLAGLLLPAGGQVRMDGFDALREPLRFRRLLGYLPESAQPDGDLTVKAYLRYRARLKGEQMRKIRHRVNEAMAACGLEKSANARIGPLSAGTRKRVALADAILLRPRVLLLDDLFAGLDPATRAGLADALASVGAFAATIVSGHELDELARCCSRFLVLKDGMLLKVATADEARGMLAP